MSGKPSSSSLTVGPIASLCKPKHKLVKWEACLQPVVRRVASTTSASRLTVLHACSTADGQHRYDAYILLAASNQYKVYDRRRDETVLLSGYGIES